MRELKDVRQSKRSGAGVDEIYEPKLWCFQQLQFLEAHTKMRNGRSNLGDERSLGKAKKVCIDEDTSREEPSQEVWQDNEASEEELNEDKEPSHKEMQEEEIQKQEQVPLRKRPKKITALTGLRKDLASMKNIIAEKKNKKFAWLGSLVALRMEEIRPEQQDDAAWEVQCLMRRLVQKSKASTQGQSTSRAMLPSDVIEVFDETVEWPRASTQGQSTSRAMLPSDVIEVFDETVEWPRASTQGQSTSRAMLPSDVIEVFDETVEWSRASTQGQAPSRDMLQNAMFGVFDEADFDYL